MRIAIIGLGYVGAVTGACLADSGHDVVLVDTNEAKVRALNEGSSPIAELGLAELVSTNVARGRLSATAQIHPAVQDSDAIIVCVGTPTGQYGDVRLHDVETVSREIGVALETCEGWRLVLITSTVPPGTVEQHLIPILEHASGKRAGGDFGVAFSPEFLREGTAIADFKVPAKTVIGANDSRTFEAVMTLYGPFSSQVITTSVQVAEMVKFTDNAWHALKVTYANEIGRICGALDIDSHAVMEVFRSDERLNISSAYLTPGFAFGGSCLPKDLRTLTYRARTLGVEIPVLDAVLPSNRNQLEYAMRRIEQLGMRRIALLGLAFKTDTDDIRESPMLELAERLLGKGYHLTIHDEHVNLAAIVGANREHLLQVLPHVASLLSDDLELVIKDAEIVVVGQASPRYADVTSLVDQDVTVLDLNGVARPVRPTANYAGLLW